MSEPTVSGHAATGAGETDRGKIRRPVSASEQARRKAWGQQTGAAIRSLVNEQRKGQ